MNTYKIEFIKGEPYCRANGILTDEKWINENIGIDGEPEITDNYIYTNDVLYIKNGKKDFYNLLQIFGEYIKPAKYDYSFNKGYGYEQSMVEKRILGSEGAFVIKNPNWLKDLKIKQYSQFKKDYPNFNETNYINFMDSLEYYYKNCNFETELTKNGI